MPQVDQGLGKQATNVEKRDRQQCFGRDRTGKLFVHLLHIGHVGASTDEFDVH